MYAPPKSAVPTLSATSSETSLPVLNGKAAEPEEAGPALQTSSLQRGSREEIENPLLLPLSLRTSARSTQEERALRTRWSDQWSRCDELPFNLFKKGLQIPCGLHCRCAAVGKLKNLDAKVALIAQSGQHPQ
jgi:hypothetical protein